MQSRGRSKSSQRDALPADAAPEPSGQTTPRNAASLSSSPSRPAEAAQKVPGLPIFQLMLALISCGMRSYVHDPILPAY